MLKAWFRRDAAHPTEVMPPPPFRTEAAQGRVSNSGFEFVLIDQRGGTASQTRKALAITVRFRYARRVRKVRR